MGHILVVDDEAGIRNLLRTVLSSQGHKVALARSGAEALLALELSPPDLILLDVNMPEMDGCGLLAVLRDTPEWRHIPVILLTAFAAPEQQATAQALGATDQLTKANFSIRDLRARVAAYLPPTADERQVA